MLLLPLPPQLLLLRCYHFSVRERPYVDDEPVVDLSKVWDIARAWTAAEEARYSAWIREMFRAPRGRELAYARLDHAPREQS